MDYTMAQGLNRGTQKSPTLPSCLCGHITTLLVILSAQDKLYVTKNKKDKLYEAYILKK